MLHMLDMRTVLLLGALLSLTMAVIMIYYSAARNTYPGFHYWTAGIVCVGLGSALITVRGALPDFLTIIVANTLIGIMPFLLVRGLDAFSGRKWCYRKVDAGILVLFLICYFHATYGSPDVAVRVIVLSLVMLYYFAQGIVIARRRIPQVLGEHNLLLECMLFFAALSMALRLGVSWVAGVSVNILAHPGPGHDTALVLTILSMMGIVSSVLILNTHRMERDFQQANREIADLANKDGLTSLYNRRYLDMALDTEFRRMQRSGRPLSLVMGDIDCFKEYNDAYGHQGGDDCLRAIADVFRQAGGRIADKAARYGGEEFLLILPDTDAEGALNIAESIQTRLQNIHMPHTTSTVADRVTLCLGVATLIPDRSNHPAQLLKMADKALYECKHNGKNQICVGTMA